MMKIKLNIDGRDVAGQTGQTILEIARENGIGIPSLCHDERVEPCGACGICVVEAAGVPKLLRACSTQAAEGMNIQTNTPRVRDNRRAALELLLSDHTGDCRAPCMLACPAQTDCQGYVGLIANGAYDQAHELITAKIPLPASIGRVCPHPCETACRRAMVEEPISIAALKQYVGDLHLANQQKITGKGNSLATQIAASTGKRIAVVGGGPGGLSAAYFLRVKGHDLTVFDAMPHMGGMLRYGIPEYRLPKSLLQAEIDNIQQAGIAFRNNLQLGRDISLEQLRRDYDAVILAVGAWRSTGLRCPGEELEGVVGGIAFLLDVAVGNPFHGKRIAVVGGGNTAMDACRTAVRLGAETVCNVYRRTKNEMPAEEIEIREAEEEGVVFKNLRSPLEIVGENGRVKALRLQVMELGAPDASGRRSPVAVPGAEETIEVDTVISAIGQKPNVHGLEAVTLTKWGTIAAGEHSFLTNLPGVFALGDATNDGADIAVTAIGEAQRAAEMVDKFLSGAELDCEPAYLVKSEKTPADFADQEKHARVKMPHRDPAVRRKDFKEVNLGLSEEDARREARRCLECGCMDVFECKLLDYANQYRVNPSKYAGLTHRHAYKEGHPDIRRNAEKCVLCGLCVRVCEDVVGAAALGLVDRGFDTVVVPALDADLRDTDCVSCGQCAAVCPTGALTETQVCEKNVPLREDVIETVCPCCPAGCGLRLCHKGGLPLRALPAEGGLLCEQGRFGYVREIAKRRLEQPGPALEALIVRANEDLAARGAALYGDSDITVEDVLRGRVVLQKL